MKSRSIFFDVLLDFLRELPEDFDRNTWSYAKASAYIETFMNNHGLTDEEEEDKSNR